MTIHPPQPCDQCGATDPTTTARADGSTTCDRCWRATLQQGHNQGLHTDGAGTYCADCPSCQPGQRVCDALRKAGIMASWEYPGYIRIATEPSGAWAFGTVNGPWGGDWTAADGQTLTSVTLPTPAEDLPAVVAAIAAAVRQPIPQLHYGDTANRRAACDGYRRPIDGAEATTEDRTAITCADCLELLEA